MTDIHESAARLEEHIIDMRRRLHRHPELGCEETETTAFIVSEPSRLRNRQGFPLQVKLPA